jgi:DNA mismatch repair protein MutL
MVPLGQFRNTFIIAIDDEGVAIIDQHVAHERILFEQISERLISRPLESQRLLSPIVIEVGPAEHQTLLTHAESMTRFGFEIDDFGGSSLRIGAAPAILDWQRAKPHCAPSRPTSRASSPAPAWRSLRSMAATMACHAAVKANDPLTREKMQYLLDELGARRIRRSVRTDGRSCCG